MNRLLDKNGLTEFIPISKNTIAKYVSKKKIPFIKIGSRVFFDPEEITEWVNSKRVPAGGFDE